MHTLRGSLFAALKCTVLLLYRKRGLDSFRMRNGTFADSDYDNSSNGRTILDRLWVRISSQGNGMYCLPSTLRKSDSLSRLAERQSKMASHPRRAIGNRSHDLPIPRTQPRSNPKSIRTTNDVFEISKWTLTFIKVLLTQLIESYKQLRFMTTFWYTNRPKKTK